MEFKVGQRVKVKPVSILKESFHGQTGTVAAVRHYVCHREGSYTMLEVLMDCVVRTAGIDGPIGHGNIVLPSDCFESITTALAVITENQKYTEKSDD